jgi:hypothetical protein
VNGDDDTKETDEIAPSDVGALVDVLSDESRETVPLPIAMIGEERGAGFQARADFETLEAPPICGQNYTAGGRVFPEKCSRLAGHKPVSSTSNHYTFGIGWWA